MGCLFFVRGEAMTTKPKMRWYCDFVFQPKERLKQIISLLLFGRVQLVINEDKRKEFLKLLHRV